MQRGNTSTLKHSNWKDESENCFNRSRENRTMVGGFRVQTVAIEGFKGFTTPKVIDLKGRHAFLLGQNGNGKSSIVEAIRWGLFGSTGRNEIVPNRGYPGRCRVEVTLIRDGKPWKLRRRLIRGASGGSDAELTDERGQSHPIREVLPQLDSLDAGEGTHIIFAPQSVPLRRQPADLTPFERTVFNHLGLTHPRALLSEINAFIEDQELVEHKHGEALTEHRDQIHRQAADLEERRGRILASPPWPGKRSPTVAESENRVRELIQELTGRPLEQSLAGVSLDGLLDAASEAVQNRRGQDQGGLEGELARVERRLAGLVALTDIQHNIKAKKSDVDRARSDLCSLLGSMSLDDFKNKISEERAAAHGDALRRDLVANARSLLGHDVADPVACPVCTTEHTRPDFVSKLQLAASRLSHNGTSDLRELEAQCRQVEECKLIVENLEKQLGQLEETAQLTRSSIDPAGEESLETSAPAGLESLIEKFRQRKLSVVAQIGNQENWLAEAQAKLRRLGDEGRFHQIQRNLVNCQESRNRFARVEKAYDDLVSFNASVREVRSTIEACLKEQLENRTPAVSKDLTQVFAALTQHPWYDRLIVDNDKLPKLELLVASSQDPLGLGHPTGVLNGQAESALELVPHFAFGQADNAPTEVYLVMLDDPTRAFDEEHIDILIQRLADLGRNVQLIVASQETSRFRSLLPTNFEGASYVIVEPENWSFHNGPTLRIEYGD